jgi:hypothetical protein
MSRKKSVEGPVHPAINLPATLEDFFGNCFQLVRPREIIRGSQDKKEEEDQQS